MNCEQNLVILRINKRCVEACLAQTPLYFVEQFVFICSAIKPLSIVTLARKNYLPIQNVIESKLYDTCYSLNNSLKYTFVAYKHGSSTCHSTDNLILAIHYHYFCREHAAFIRLSGCL